MKNCYVYSHTRLDNNTIFYIGIGKHKARKSKYSRANEKTRRTLYWKNIVNKCNYKIEILHDDLTKEEAICLEIKLIALYKRTVDGGTLCNITKGGEGVSGRIVTNETKEKIKKTLLGHKISEDTKEKIRQTLLKKGYIASKTHRKVINTANGEIFNTIKLAANSIGMKRPTLQMKLLGRNKNDTNFRYL